MQRVPELEDDGHGGIGGEDNGVPELKDDGHGDIGDEDNGTGAGADPIDSDDHGEYESTQMPANRALSRNILELIGDNKV
jgi:hypothetical protein